MRMVPIVIIVREDTASKLETEAAEIAADQPGFFGPLLENHGWTPAQFIGGVLLSDVLDENDDKAATR